MIDSYVHVYATTNVDQLYIILIKIIIKQEQQRTTVSIHQTTGQKQLMMKRKQSQESQWLHYHLPLNAGDLTQTTPLHQRHPMQAELFVFTLDCH